MDIVVMPKSDLDAMMDEIRQTKELVRKLITNGFSAKNGEKRPVLTTTLAAERVGLHPRSLVLKARMGKIPHEKRKGHYFFYEEDIMLLREEALNRVS